MSKTPVCCGNPNCEWTGDIDQTAQVIRNFWGRVSPGDEMPAGECPECGWLSYLVKAEKEPLRVIAIVEGGVVQCARSNRPVNLDVADLDNLDSSYGDPAPEEEARIKDLAAEADGLPLQCY